MVNRIDERNKLLAVFPEDPKGFRDQHGYIIDIIDGHPGTLGEGTLHTAIATIAIAAGNYYQDSWDVNFANKSLKELLTTLLKNSWGNRDNLGRVHPIRHPDVKEYDVNGKFMRHSPLTKDSVGAIVAATYYAYNCPNSNQEVRMLARELMTKWTEYLILFQWRTHSNYFAGEFESKKIPGEKNLFYKNIFSDESQGKVTYKGIESFMLLPHEIYTIQNVAAKLGIPTSHWNIWENEMPAELKQTIADYVAPYIAEEYAKGLEYVLQKLNFSLPYSVQLGAEDWKLGKVEGTFEVQIPSHIKEQIIKNSQIAVKDFIRETVRLDNYKTHQAADLLGIAINRILNLLPDNLGHDSWRSILTSSLQQVIPWVTGSAWVEAATFLGTQLLLKLMGPDVISYTVWSFTSECETRPEMRDILKPGIQNFFSVIRDEGNPNGLWAWLAEDSDMVQQQLQLFESKDSDYSWKFAYGSTPFNQWVAEAEDPSEKQKNSNKHTSRLDYLILDSLAEKKAPLGITNINMDWFEEFKDMVKQLANQFIAQIKNQFVQVGNYTREIITGTGELIRETWTSSMEFTQEKLLQGKVVAKNTWNRASDLIHRWIEVDGKISEEYWNRLTEKYWKGVWSQSGDMIERVTHTLDGKQIEEYWNRTTEKYWKGVWSKIGGTANDFIQRVTHTLDGKQIEEYWNRTTEKYWKGVWSKIGGTGNDLIERVTHTLDGKQIEEYWNRTTEKYWKGVWSKIGGTANDLIEQVTHTLDGKQIQEYWNRTTEKYWKGAWASIGGTANDLIERVTHTLDGKHIEEYWNRKTEKYWKGIWSKIGGTANDLIERVIHTLDGKHIEEYWNRKTEKYWKGIWSKIGGTANDMIERIIHASDGKHIEEYWNRTSERYWKGVWSQSGDMIERVIEKRNGLMEIEVWNEAGKWGKSVFNEAGELIEQLGETTSKSLSDILKSISPIPTIHWGW
ncbi:hypothetical protein CQ058_04550 [Bacillus sp. MYb56]|uniref:hypothetical protein n=1 Tax=Bacillus sp. MYb56 TaxID=1827287 RepID=UPI000CFD9F67|nr:hypothetical protein [Bacillus sp. MYb56]PRD11797.1 hypothetical protein CQ058_04550 [Bacillus sp. MYb56]